MIDTKELRRHRQSNGRSEMTTEIELLPLPEWMSRYTIPSDGFECDKVAMLDDRMHDYARANVANAIAPLQAEIEALRAEVDALRAKP